MSKAKAKSKHNQVYVLAERCKGCGFCIEFCPQHALFESNETNSKGYHTVGMDDSVICTGCDMCSWVCPEFAIYVESAEEEAQKA